VTDDSWDPDRTDHTPFLLYNWPTSGEPPVSEPTGTTGWHSEDITPWLQAEVDSGNSWFSIKFQQAIETPIYERIASPTAWYSLHRPEIMVVYSDTSTSKPDLTVNRHDIAFNTMWPVPYDPVTIEATIHNVGGSATPTGFLARFYDNGQWINNQDVFVNPIPGGGGTGTAQITWYPTEGEHNIEVIADVTNQI